MIEISEKVLQSAIRAGLEMVREDEQLFDRVFSRLNVTEATRLKRYIAGNKVNVTIGYPVNRSKLPCYAIMLGGENESENYLGEFSDELDNAEATGMGLDTDEIVVEEVVRVEKYGEFFKFNTSKRNVEAVTYAVDIHGNPVDLDGLEILDSEKGEVMVCDQSLTHRQKITISYVYRSTAYTSFGSMFNKSYRIEVWATNGDLVVHLYHLLKWLMLFSRKAFYQAGWNEVKLGGADFEPVPEGDNEITYRRAMSVEFLVEETYELDYKYIQDIIVKFNKEEGIQNE